MSLSRPPSFVSTSAGAPRSARKVAKKKGVIKKPKAAAAKRNKKKGAKSKRAKAKGGPKKKSTKRAAVAPPKPKGMCVLADLGDGTVRILVTTPGFPDGVEFTVNKSEVPAGTPACSGAEHVEYIPTGMMHEGKPVLIARRGKKGRFVLKK